MRRLTKDEHLSSEFAATWPQYDLDSKTRALLSYAKKLTQEPSMVEDTDVEALREAGWDEQGIYEATASPPCSTTVVGWRPLPACRWTGSRLRRTFPKRPPTSESRHPTSEANFLKTHSFGGCAGSYGLP